MNPIGLDLSLTGSGIVTGRDRAITVKTLSVMAMGARLQKIIDAIDLACVQFDDPILFVEAVPTHGKGMFIAPLAEIHGVLHLFCHQNKIKWVPVTASQLKKFATGNGNAKKPDMRMELFKRAGVDFKDDNQVDAWWLWEMGNHVLEQPTVELPKTHLATLSKVIARYQEAISA